MNTKTLALGFAVGLGTMAAASLALQDPAAIESTAQDVATEAMDDMQKAWMEAMEKYCTPSKEHEMLAKRAGDYTAAVNYWMLPDSEVHTSTGTASFEMVLDGRYLQQEYAGSWDGMPFGGGGMMGYDRIRNEYFNVWVDSMGTGMHSARGTANGQMVEYAGEMPDPMTGTYVKVRTVDKQVSDDEFTVTMYTNDPAGTEYKQMEITYTRVK